MRSKASWAVICGALAMAGIATAQPTLGSLDGAFSSVQAARGGQIFAGQCAACHTPADAAQKMFERGSGMSLEAYHTRLGQLMPPQTETRPSSQGYLDIIAYLARTAGAATGARTAEVAQTSWRGLTLPTGGTLIPKAAMAASLDWRAWRGDLAGTGYSPADQINAANVAKLEVAWRWTGANFGPSPEARNITTPLMVGGVLFATAGNKRDVVAIDAATGETLWLWRPQDDPARFANAPRKGAGRGVAYWSDGKAARVFTVTPGFNLAALDARTGRAIAGFGRDGIVDLMRGLRGLPRQGLPDIGSQSPPLVVGDVVVVGPAHSVGLRPKSRENVKGDVRGFDVRTGKLLWTFHTIPVRGEPGYDTWAAGSAEYTGNGGVWAPMAADARTGAIFVPVESGTSDLYGGARAGSNLNTSSLVSLDGRTGKVRWKQQLVHHDIWDWDIPAMPVLADVPAPGGVRHVVVQVTKQALLFVFDRDTGQPIWPIVEVPVAQSDVPGEKTWPTQPRPSRPAPFDRLGFSTDDLIDFTPQLRAEALAAIKPYRLGGYMAPPSLADAPDGTKGTLAVPGFDGGGLWQGGVYDPESGLFYVGSPTKPMVLAMTKAPAGSDLGFVSQSVRTPTVRGLPILKPPWGRITAVDLKSGDHAWMIANADTPRDVAANPALKGLNLPRTGAPTHSGLLVTKTLLFAGEGDGGSPVFRAHDKATGRILAQIALPASQTGLPMTYVWKGRQFIVMAVGDGQNASEIIALALPD
jgi:glucose dehydrogenase